MENEEERRQRYRAFLAETVSDEEKATIFRADQRGQLTGGKASVDEIEVRLDRRIVLRGPGRPRKTGKLDPSHFCVLVKGPRAGPGGGETMKNAAGRSRGLFHLVPAITLILCALLAATPTPCPAETGPYSLNLYTGRLTTNDWEDFFSAGDQLDFTDSYLVAASLARRIHAHRDKASFELEGQIVKHFNIQKHWELNALGVARWEDFWWDDVLDTSLAFGFGPSYATDKPKVEEENDGNTSRFLIYWMLELALSLPEHPSTALIARIHHRSDAFGLVADDGGSNALAFGLKYRF